MIDDSIRWVLGNPRPQTLFGLLFGEETLGAHKAIGVLGLTVGKANLVQHAVTIKGVVALGGFKDGGLGVTEVDAGEIVGDLTFDLKVPRVVLAVLGTPQAGPVRMIIIRGQTRFERLSQLNFHAGTSPQSFTSSTPETVSL